MMDGLTDILIISAVLVLTLSIFSNIKYKIIMLVAPPASTKNTTGNIVLKFPVTLILSQFCVEHQLVHIVTEEENLEHLFRDM